MNKSTPIAIVGMGCAFPGAMDVQQFWRNITNKIDTTIEIPEDRWVADPALMVTQTPSEDRAYSKWACIAKDFKFEPAHFETDSDFLLSLDPLYHMVLHAGKTAWDSLQRQPNVNPKRIGTILAAIVLPSEGTSAISRRIFGRYLEKHIFPDHLTDSSLSLGAQDYFNSRVAGMPAILLAHELKISGGAYTLDAACASSLYAVKLACDRLISGNADVMITGGVSRPECFYTQAGFSQLRALSPSGRCAPFDAKADGLVVGEGAGILILKRLPDALAHGDDIHGVITGIGLSNDMRGNLLAPDSEGQLRAMKKAYECVGWHPHMIDHIECHGAGTPVGDITELNSLRLLWGEEGWYKEQCAIGSVKSMIGHLLTAAGAAGMIKTVLALKNKTLPPSLKFEKPAPNSPLINSAFRVQTDAEPWLRRSKSAPRRAAVSAFGFGGINAHMLFEEFSEDYHHKSQGLKHCSSNPKSSSIKPKTAPDKTTAKAPPVAIVGMSAAFPNVKTLKDFQHLIFNGDTIIRERPADRWKGADVFLKNYLADRAKFGGYLSELMIEIGEFQIPPNEIPQILPQQLLMLKTAKDALLDAGMPLREARPAMGTIIGINQDFDATNFHLRWHLEKVVRIWNHQYGIHLEAHTLQAWLNELLSGCVTPLRSSNVLGALGGIVASRVAREFKFGGSSYVVSSDELSGLQALQLGANALQQNELDAVLIGAVELGGDARSIICRDVISKYSDKNEIYPFDRRAEGTLPGEGAVALVLKRLDQAKADGDRIYAVVRGIGTSNHPDVAPPAVSKAIYKNSLSTALTDANIDPLSISFLEAHGNGTPLQDKLEAEALHDIFSNDSAPREVACAIGSLKPNIGNTGAVAGLASIIKTGLCLYHSIIPPLRNFRKAPESIEWDEKLFHLPAFPQFWMRNRIDGPRSACVSAMTPDGNCAHAILEAFETSADNQIQQSGNAASAHRRPLGPKQFGLFVIEGNKQEDMLKGLDSLTAFLSNQPPSGRSPDNDRMEHLSHEWYRANPLDPGKKLAVSIIGKSVFHLRAGIEKAREAVNSGVRCTINGLPGIAYSPTPFGAKGKLSLVFPGSCNHYVGMGRDIGILWPELLGDMDADTSCLYSQFLPQYYHPHRTHWEANWEGLALDRIESDQRNMIFGQVCHGILMWQLMQKFNIRPSAAIGYSLGESTALFALNAWPDRGVMQERMNKTNLFTTALAGPCTAVKKAWGISENREFIWRVAAVNRPASKVRPAVADFPLVRLLIVNTPQECVIGGEKTQVEAIIRQLGCESFPLEGVVTVHCDALTPVIDDYRGLHRFPTAPIEGIDFYSCALGRSYELSMESTADSITRQALEGFDFNKTIHQAYDDGIRIFLEMGPRASCTRMIQQILKNKPHLAVSTCIRGEDDYLTIIKCLGMLISERVPVNLDALYGTSAYPHDFFETNQNLTKKNKVIVPAGGLPLIPVSPPVKETEINPSPIPSAVSPEPLSPAIDTGSIFQKDKDKESMEDELRISPSNHTLSQGIRDNSFSSLICTMDENIRATADAHKKFLNFSEKMIRSYGEAFTLQNKLLAIDTPEGEPQIQATQKSKKKNVPPPLFDYNMCMEFATGSVAKVLGPDFSVVDTYNVRVRLPDAPLMLVDRILSIEGKKRSMSSGRLITEHDVLPGAWYLDADRAPVCISVEAGQADLFLSSYLGIDHIVKGARAYRLLDATVTFHRGLPKPGETIRFDIRIDKFIRQGETHLFFFKYDGYINEERLITMRDGCAGFFTSEEVENSGGIILTEEENAPIPGKAPSNWQPPVPMHNESYSDAQIECLRHGDLSGCFGGVFDGITLPRSLHLPGGRMRLIHRVLSLIPNGGRYGLGAIRAEADIHPNDWFLICHFVDDMVMPGTLMYECCAHTLRVLLLRMGWITDKPGVRYEPVLGIGAKLKCRGPVTPKTKKVHYELQLKEIGYNPEPYVIADAHMFGDGRHIVHFENMSMKLSGLDKQSIDTFWRRQKNTPSYQQDISSPKTINTETDTVSDTDQHKLLFTHGQILAFATGNPSACYGEPYKVFDHQRTIARLPGPPFCFIDGIKSIEPEAWQLKADGWIEAVYTVNKNDWYFMADRTGSMPFCVLLEIALQPCGWLAAYMGSALKSKKDLKFRNLGGNGKVHKNIVQGIHNLTMRTRCTKVSETIDMIIENFDFQVFADGQPVYTGDTYFGFFTTETLENQVGLGKTDQIDFHMTKNAAASALSQQLTDDAPMNPDEAAATEPATYEGLSMPAKAMRMIDRIVHFIPDGGPNGLGYARATKKVVPDEWFFKAHFFQDPVCPGSLGIESMLQVFKFIARHRWRHLNKTHRVEFLLDETHKWIYRGQITPENKLIEVETLVTKIDESGFPKLIGNGWLKVDGLFIYKVENLGIQLVPIDG